MTDEKLTTLERHVSTIIGAMILAIIVWVGSTVANNKEGIAVFGERLATLMKVVEEIHIKLNNQYSKSDALKFENIMERRVDSIERRILILENGDKHMRGMQ